jgi:hypothetical protein
MTRIQKMKILFGHLELVFGIYLGFGNCDLEFESRLRDFNLFSYNFGRLGDYR